MCVWDVHQIIYSYVWDIHQISLDRWFHCVTQTTVPVFWGKLPAGFLLKHASQTSNCVPGPRHLALGLCITLSHRAYHTLTHLLTSLHHTYPHPRSRVHSPQHSRSAPDKHGQDHASPDHDNNSCPHQGSRPCICHTPHPNCHPHVIMQHI